MVPLPRAAIASASADLPLAVGPATISASGIAFVTLGIGRSLWLPVGFPPINSTRAQRGCHAGLPCEARLTPASGERNASHARLSGHCRERTLRTGRTRHRGTARAARADQDPGLRR